MRLLLSFILPLTAVLAACGSSKDANNRNFEKAINNHFAKDCITIDPHRFSGYGQHYPVTIPLQQTNAYISQAVADQNNAKATHSLELLVKAGVLSVSDGTTRKKQLFLKGEEIVPAKVYSLTDIGKKAIVGADNTAMCVGHYKVDEIVRFTQPNNALGQMDSQVSFTFSPVDVPDWAKSAEIRKGYGLDSILVKQRKATRTVILASDGWIDVDDLGR